jgi:dipeptidyl-peptidase-4
MQIDIATGTVSEISGRGWIGPRLSPDGTRVAAVRDNDVHVVSLANGHTTHLTHGGTETRLAAWPSLPPREELARPDGLMVVARQPDASL